MDEPAINPYQSPAFQQEDGWTANELSGSVRPAYKLYSAGSVALATFLGSLLAGGVIMAINYRRLGQGIAAIHAVVWSAVATVIVISLGMLIPDDVNIPSVVFLVPQILGVYFLAKSLQGPAIESHGREGGLSASAWAAAGIGILTGIAVAAILFGVLIVMSSVLDG